MHANPSSSLTGSARIASHNKMPRNLLEVFKTYQNHPWILVRPLGNWGDVLLYEAAERIANAAGLQWSSCETFDFERLVTAGHCIYLQGGGGLNDWSSGRAFANLVNAAGRRAPIVVQGPASAGGSPDWLRQRLSAALERRTCDQVIFFARERETHRLLLDCGLQGEGVAVELDHDTALSLSTADLLQIAGLDRMPEGRYHLVVCREDNEQPGLRDSAKEAGAAGNAICIDPAREAMTFRQWVRMHLFARTITSNRLHSAIAGVIAGKPVTMSSGSYHKNRCVWEFSLADRAVQWAEVIHRPAAPLWDRLPVIVRNSHKIRRLRLALRGVPLS